MSAQEIEIVFPETWEPSTLFGNLELYIHVSLYQLSLGAKDSNVKYGFQAIGVGNCSFLFVFIHGDDVFVIATYPNSYTEKGEEKQGRGVFFKPMKFADSQLRLSDDGRVLGLFSLWSRIHCEKSDTEREVSDRGYKNFVKNEFIWKKATPPSTDCLGFKDFSNETSSYNVMIDNIIFDMLSCVSPRA